MKIAMRAREGEESRWKKVVDRNYRDEAHLQQLLYESPDLIPIEDLEDGGVSPGLFIKEAGLPGSGSTDLIGVGEAGNITVVECKLATNPDIRRKVIGQVLEYAAYLWQMSYHEFDDIVQRREGQPLAELMRQQLEAEGSIEDWSEEEFRAGVAEALQQGVFRIIVAVDEVTDELRRVIRYLNACGPAGFSIYGLEMHYFADDQTELLVPQLVGMTTRKPTKAGRRRKWDAESFFREAEANNSLEVVQVMRDLLEFAEQEADRVRWGRGKKTGTYTFYLLQGEARISLFTVSHKGRLSLNLGQASGKVGRVPESILREWLATLREIYGFQTLSDDLGRPSFPLASVFSDPAALREFKQSVLDLKEAVRRLDGESV